MSDNDKRRSNVIKLDKSFFIKNKKRDESQEERRMAEKSLAIAAKKLDW